MPAPGAIITDRELFFRQAKDSVTRPSSVGLTLEEVALRYRGFDGRIWPDWLGLDPTPEGVISLGELSSITASSAWKEFGRNSQVVFIAPPEHGGPGEAWDFVGFDLGLFESSYSRFSIIVHEILFGAEETLRKFSKHLNENLLLREPTIVAEILKARQERVLAGADLEELDAIHTYSIFNLK